MRLVNKTLTEKTEETNMVGVKVGETTVGFSLTKPRNIQWKVACPDSSTVRRVKYDEVSKSMRVEFHNGREYEYEDVPFDTYKDLIHAESVGKFFNASVRNAFSFTEL